VKKGLKIALTASILILAAVAVAVILKLAILPDIENKSVETLTTEAAPKPGEAWVQTAEIEPGVDYVIVSNGYALVSSTVSYGTGGGHSFAGVPVSTEGGVLGGEVTPEMIWRFEPREDTKPGDAYYTADDMMITQNGRPIVRDIWRGEAFLRFCVWEPSDGEIPPEQSSFQILRRGDTFFLSAVSGSEDTNDLLYYSKYYGAFVYVNNYPDLTQRLFAVKLFRKEKKDEPKKEISAVSLRLREPAAGEPALWAYLPEDVTSLSVESTRWSGEPAVFCPDTEYTAQIVVRANAGYRFADDARVTVNGLPAEARVQGTRLYVTVSFPKTDKATKLDGNDADPRALLVTSDMHSYTDKLYSFLSRLRDAGEYPRTVSFAGDMYTASSGYFKRNWGKYADMVSATVAAVFPASQPVYTMGNHDWESLYDESFYDGTGLDCFAIAYGCARVGAIWPGGDTSSPYVIFNLGATDVTHGEYYSMFRDSDLERLRSFLDEVEGKGKLVVVSSHWPLHFAINATERTVLYAEKVIDLLNDYAGKVDIIFVWGHNHYDDPSMLTVRGPGDKIECDKEGKISRKIKFIYANAGAMLHGTGLLIKFDGKNIRLTYYALPDGEEKLEACGTHVFGRVK